ncbi:conserved unknown protein [Ectocarpus siliculosus]|uniref:UBA domain-containing protein n=1 Tax=Ectocarpus siliculosus TaxID=2880 RepID=D8LT96_ECTSI|nr:conserved unknown protein [Ectocarpus siliculosus]|eukprot:CBN77967.1 conserved unknown protein [Ectocarpus siliculosus]
MWNFFGKGYKEAAEEDEDNDLSLGTGPVDMTTLDITYITHRLLAIGCPVDGPSDRDANRNNVDDLSNWLVNDHKGHFLVWNISDHRSNNGGGRGGGGGRQQAAGTQVSRKLHQRLQGQVLDIPWGSRNRRCYVPSIRHLLRVCYSIKGWLDLDPENMAAVFCANGKARTSVLLACYLRFEGEESTALEAYRRVWAKRDPEQKPEQVILHTPRSLFALFDNFDCCIRLGRPPRGGAGGGLLVGVALNGLPLAEPPVLEVYGPTQLLYSSTQEEEDSHVLWNEDQGFFKVNKPLTGDFVVIARFKGTDGAAETGPEGVLFRYCNHTCFLPQGEQVVLRKSEVDVMPSYRDQIPDDVFSVSLVLVPEEEEDAGSSFSFQEQDQVKVGPAATQQGLADLSSFHFVTPLLPRLDKLLGRGFPPEASTLALQLANNDLSAAITMMKESPLQDLMTYRLALSPRSSEGFSPNRGLRAKSISVVSPGSMLESDQGNLSLDHYEDSQHSRDSLDGPGGGIGAFRRDHQQPGH